MKPLDPRLLRTASAARVLLAAGAVVAVGHTASIIAFCWFAAQTIAAVVDGVPVERLGALVIATALSILARALTQAALDALAVRGAARVKSQLRARAITALDAGGSELLGATSSARVATLLGQGLDALDGYLARYLPQLILTAVATPLIVGVLLLADTTTGITVILTLPIIPVFMVLIGLSTRAVQQKQWRQLGVLAHGFLEVVQGLSTLMVFGRQHRQVDRIAEVTDDYRRRTMAILRLSFLSGFALELAASLSVALVAVSIGIRLIDGSLLLGLGLFVLILVPEAYLPLRQVGAQFHAASEGLAAAEDVLELLEREPASVASASLQPTASIGRSLPVSAETIATSDRSASSSSTDAGRTPPALELRGLAVRRGDRVVVDGLSGAWMPGTVLVVTGPSGAGKSSLLGAVLGFIAHDGEVLLDGAALHAEDRLGRIAWAGQRPDLTGGPLDAVVALGAPTIDHAQVTASLAWAGLDDVPRGTVLGAAGDGLSGGQAQRVALARAHYHAQQRDCRVVLLDEPTSALDAESERHVIAGLRALADEGRLVVVVTHRRSVMAAADERVVVEAVASAALEGAGR
ncbi:thiol reductant ABC exporter subunit CydD [Chryseoglobus frigidaquae]|nr:thiol reductant ABC exporter subunit CydD [Microcella frigidaquae]NHN45257.1 thiol reductant ABC exporter subunit CydD [Microcella frigidaquae]